MVEFSWKRRSTSTSKLLACRHHVIPPTICSDIIMTSLQQQLHIMCVHVLVRRVRMPHPLTNHTPYPVMPSLALSLDYTHMNDTCVTDSKCSSLDCVYSRVYTTYSMIDILWTRKAGKQQWQTLSKGVSPLILALK